MQNESEWTRSADRRGGHYRHIGLKICVARAGGTSAAKQALLAACEAFQACYYGRTHRPQFHTVSSARGLGQLGSECEDPGLVATLVWKTAAGN